MTWRKKRTPIAVDIGARSIKLLQFDADGDVIDCVRRDRSAEGTPLAVDLRDALDGRQFRGRDVITCLNQDNLLVHNVRLPKSFDNSQKELAEKELRGRLPEDIGPLELRCVEAADVRHAEGTLKELIVFGCEKKKLHEFLGEFRDAGLRLSALDVEPLALLRCYLRQFRRTDDSQHRAIYAHIGYSRTGVIIAQGDDLMFVKYIDIGGKHLDAAVARQFQLDDPSAQAMRRNNGDRRSSANDENLAQSVARAVRPVLATLGQELSMCVRYNNVTFRGTPISRFVLGGGEATESIAEVLNSGLVDDFVLSEPFRDFRPPSNGPPSQWDIAVGLAYRQAFEEVAVTA